MAPPPLSSSPSSGAPWDDHPLFTLESLYRAYRQCRRRKRNTRKALAFERHLEDHLVDLRDELVAGSYAPEPFDAFLVEKPKRREIFAAGFRDRVVHHLLVGHLEPRWERRFIHDSYACRKGKGTHNAVDRLRSFLRRATRNGTRPAFYLQLDVRGFFVAINRRILCRQLEALEPDPAVRWLLRVILFHQPTDDCRFRDAKRADFERLPRHKTLLKCPPDCGLPIGNLTSQFFANVYLDLFDQFVKHELKAPLYLRYCDDMVWVSASEDELRQLEPRVEGFLSERLGLELNPRRRLRPVADGIDFLGYIVRPSHLLVRRRVVAALRRRLDQAERRLRRLGLAQHGDGRWVFPWPWPLLEEIHRWLTSYRAHLKRASSQRLVESLPERYPWLREYFVDWTDGVTLRCPIPRQALRLNDQKAWFRQHLPGHVLMLRQGGFWELLLPPSAGGSGQQLTELEAWPRRIPKRLLEDVKPLLWRCGLPVAWIAETGRRLCAIDERALRWRWASAATPAPSWLGAPVGVVRAAGTMRRPAGGR